MLAVAGQPAHRPASAPARHTGNDLATPPVPVAGKGQRFPLSDRVLRNSVLLPRALGEAGYLTFQSGKLWNTSFREVGFTHGMTATPGRHGDAGLAIGRKGLQPLFDFTLARGLRPRLNNLALQRPDDVRRWKAMQDQAWR